MTVKIGSGKYDNESKVSRTYLPSFKEGSNIVRILPPVGNCAESGTWYAKWKIHFGFKGVPGKDQKEGKTFVFACPEEGTYNSRLKKFIVTKECPECARIRENKAALKKAESELISKGKDEKTARKIVREAKENAALNEFDRVHSMAEKVFVNGLTQDGQIGLLGIPRGVGKEAIELIKAYFAKKQRDPLETSGGFWLNFSKNGQGQFNTEYKVAIHKQEKIVDGETVEVEVKAPLSEEILSRMESECFDLSDLYPRITVEQVKRMVDSHYDPTVVSEVYEDVRAAKDAVKEEDGTHDPFAE